MRLVIIVSTLLLNLFSCQLVHSVSKSELAKETLAGFTQGQEEFDELEKNCVLHHDLVLLMGSSEAKKDFFTHHASELVDLTSNSTLLPHVMLNTRTKTEFLDFSIMGEKIESAQRIPRAYFTKKMVNLVSAVKLLLLVDFPSFDKQIDVLVHKAAESIGNIETFLSSISLVVTQVQNEQQMQKVEDRLKYLVKSPGASNETASIINALHVEYEGIKDRNRLGFVKNQSGKILKRYKIKDLGRVIDFASHDSDDYMYKPCQKDLPDCASLIKLLRRNLSEVVRYMGRNMIDFHAAVEKQLHDLDKPSSYFSDLWDSFNNFFGAKELSKKGIKNPGQMVEQIVEYSRAANVDLSSENLQLSANYAKYLVFLQGPDGPEDISWILDQLLPVREYLDSSTQWYKFLLNLDRQILSEYMVQLDIGLYKNVTSQLLEDIQKAKSEKNNDISKSLNNFMNSLPEQNAAQRLKGVEVTRLSVPKLEALKKLLSTTLMHNGMSVKWDPKSKKTTYSGFYIKLSDIYDEERHDFKIGPGKEIEVFALYKIFFDVHRIVFLYPRSIRMAFIAPYWDFRNENLMINLDFAPGGSSKQPASHFLGIGTLFINYKSFLLSGLNAQGKGRGGTMTFIGPKELIKDVHISEGTPGFNHAVKHTTAELDEERKRISELVKPVSFGQSINSYKSFLREHLVGNVRESLLEKFSLLLGDNEAIIDLYDVKKLTEEFRELEDQFWQLGPKISLLPSYRSLLYQIKNYATKLKNYKKLSQDNVGVLRYLYTAALSKIINLENNVDANLVVDLNAFMVLVKYNVDLARGFKKTKTIYGYERDYRQELMGKIDEAQRYVTDVVSPEIHRTVAKLDEKVLKLVDETVALEAAVLEEKKKLIEKRKSLQSSMILSAIFGVIKVASLFLNFLGPVGTAAGAVIAGAASMSESLLVDSSGVDANTILALPGAVNEFLLPVSDFLVSKQKLLDQQLEKAQQMLKDLPEKEKLHIKDIEREINDSREKLHDEMKKGKEYDPASFQEMNTLREKMDDLFSKKITALEKKKEQGDAKVSKQLEVIGHFQNIFSIAQASVDVYQKLSSQQKNIDEVGNLIRSAEQKYHRLKQFEKQIYSVIVPVCKNIQASVDRVKEQFQGKSSAALVISKWKVQSALKGVREEIKKMTNGFKVQEEFVDIFNKVEEGINIMVQLYDIMDEYHDKAELVKFISNINDHRLGVVTNNADLNEAVNDLMLKIQNNVVLQNYKVATNAIKHNVFPFAHELFAYSKLPEVLKTNDTDTLVTYFSNQLDDLQQKLASSDSTINKWDAKVHGNTTFNDRDGTLKPFYTWKYNEHKNKIEKLLNGQEVMLKADIKHGFKGNAIKFNKIGINFASPNKTIEGKLRKLLRGFSVTLIHLGHSFYRCDDRIYMIPSANQTIKYTMNHDVISNAPAVINNVYSKLANNKPILSPYATWKIQLNHEDHLNELSKYASEMVDLVLEGTGQYVELNLPGVCNTGLDQYYARSNSQADDIQVYEKLHTLI